MVQHLKKSFLLCILFLIAVAYASTSGSNDEIGQATLGGGCFWCTEAIFQRVPGVIKVESGYAGGQEPNPTYQFVKAGNSGYAEVIRLYFNPLIISYEKILHAFFFAHDPTTLNRQGIDVGNQYRSAIFYHNDEQKEIAKKTIKIVDAKKIYKDPVVTEVNELKNYYPAENYHQNYFNTFQSNQYCTVDTADIAGKIDKFLKIYKDIDSYFVVDDETILKEDKNSTVTTEDNAKSQESPHDEQDQVAEEGSDFDEEPKIIYPINSFHPWHNISNGEHAPEIVQAVIEIQIGSQAKYELDKATGLLKLERVLEKGFHFPANYGIIPQTLVGTNPLRILVISSVDLLPLTLAEARVFGALKVIDDGELEYQVLAVVDKDRAYSHVKELSDFEPRILDTFSGYFENYKKEEDVAVRADEFIGRKETYEVIKKAVESYKSVFKADN